MPYLIAMTPRAGRWNHRYLVPPDLNLSTVVLGRLTRMAGQQPQGPAWLAVSHEVQQVGGGRVGQELLILGDLDVQRLSHEAREHLLKRLRQRLLDLGELIAHGVEWEQEGRVDPVIRPELAQWYAADFHPSGLLESRAPDWSLTSVISMKERKAIKEDKEENESKGIKEEKEKYESKRFWMIGAAVSVVGLLLVTGIYHYPFKLNPRAYVEVDKVICEMTDISPRAENSSCELTNDQFKQLCRTVNSQPSNCKEDIKIYFKKMQDVRNNFRFPENTWSSSEGGCFKGAELLREGGEEADVRNLDNEIFGSNETKILFTNFLQVLKYEKNIEDACKALNVIYPNKPCNIHQSNQWEPKDYNIALLVIDKFLKEIHYKEGGEDLSVLHDFFDWDCFKKPKDDKIKSRLECFKEEPMGKTSWAEFTKGKGNNPNNYKYKAISLFEPILKLKSEALQSCP